uniref:CWF19-like protein 2 n=1 Tax=Odobenus rosmarus divergens TaxID=9708 RepID=UPI00063C17DC|nr:PREDICTED: CWF19-like protein 2 [Odobenus rosmarus divergens]
MAATSGRFESARSIEERKEQTRIARAEVLRQAKANFEKEERRKERKRLRGEATWMLPDVNERIEQFSQEHSLKKKKKKDKHSKKVKKEKKKKSRKQKYEKNNESTDSSSSSEDEWVEAVPSQIPGREKAWKVKGENSEREDNPVIQRDEWMTVDFMSVKTVSLSSLKAGKEAMRKTEQEKTQALEQVRVLKISSRVSVVLGVKADSLQEAGGPDLWRLVLLLQAVADRLTGPSHRPPSEGSFPNHFPTSVEASTAPRDCGRSRSLASWHRVRRDWVPLSMWGQRPALLSTCLSLSREVVQGQFVSCLLSAITGHPVAALPSAVVLQPAPPQFTRVTGRNDGACLTELLWGYREKSFQLNIWETNLLSWKKFHKRLISTALYYRSKVSVVEDGGLSWLRKSYQRMKEQAEKQNRNFEDIVAERYGSLEVFQSKLEEAEKTASTKEDYKRERWRKPAYSDKAQSSQESRKSDLVKYNKNLRHRYSSTDTTNTTNKDKSSGDEKDNRFGSLETCRRQSNPRQNQDFSSLGNLKPKFLRPSDDEELSSCSKGRNFEPSSSSSALVAQDSVRYGFRKPTENSEESSSSWSQSSGRGGDRKCSYRRSLETRGSVDSGHISEDVREKSQEESLRDDSLKKEHLQDRKSPFARGGPEDDSIHILSVDEKNKLGARIIKAEMMGNMELAERLKAQLEKANKFKETVTPISSKESGVGNEDQEVILVRTDQSGRVWPIHTPGKSLESKGGRRKRQMASTHEEKERVRYFHDDDNLSLNDLVRNEKMGTAENQSKLFMRMASKFMGKTDGDYYTLDDLFVSKAAEREPSGEEEENQRRKAIAEHQSLAAQMERCLYCLDSSQFPKHLIVAIGVKVYLCLPNFRSLTEGHCLIVPLQHHRAATLLDEDVWEEIQMFRKSLVKMFEDKGLDCVFLETHMGMKKHCHMVYECIPLPKEVGEMAPIYFKKAIMESDEEWSMNKKLIDLSSKDIRKSVPRGLPYFAVDFGLQGGFAHVIEDQHKFPHYFGKEIIGGMLDIEPRLWRKGIQESFEDQRKKALQFAQWWKPFDFTKSKKC